MMLRPQDQAFDRALTDWVLQYRGAHRFEGEPYIPTEAAGAAARQRGLELRRLMPQDAAPPVRLHWEESIATVLTVMEEDLRYPSRFVQGLTGYVSRTVSEDPRPFAERLPGLLARAEVAPDLMRELGRMARLLTPHRVQMLEQALTSLRRVIPVAQAHVASHWPQKEALQGALARLQGAAAHLQAELAGITPQAVLEDLPYEQVMAEKFGASLPQTLTWYQAEVDACHQRYLELAARLNPSLTPKEILARELPHAPSPSAMFAEMRGYVETARRASLDLITLPEGETCIIAEVPEQIKDSYPWGGYSGPPILSGRLDGRVFLNQHNYTAVSRGWMQMMALHECYPGHHAQKVKAATSGLPESFQAALGMTRDSHLSEGIAHRSEELLQHIFPDRAFPLFVAYRRLHTAVRIRADIDLHHHRRPVEEVCNLYVTYLDFTPAEARGQVRFQEMMPGYMTTYYTGMKALAEMEQRLRVSDRRWNELLFSSGYVSLKVLEALAGA